MGVEETRSEQVRPELWKVAERFRPVTLARDHHLPVHESLASLLPGGGLRRGSTVEIAGQRGATSLALAVASEATATGSWAAVVGMRSMGLVAASELGVDLRRLVLIAEPSPREWPTVVGALLDAFDVVLASPVRVQAADVRRLTAKMRERGPCLVLVPDARSALDGRRVSGSLAGWTQQADVRLEVAEVEWTGLGYGHGNLQARRVAVTSSGRREAGRLCRAELWLPAPGGGIRRVESADRAASPVVMPLHRAG